MRRRAAHGAWRPGRCGARCCCCSFGCCRRAPRSRCWNCMAGRSAAEFLGDRASELRQRALRSRSSTTGLGRCRGHAEASKLAIEDRTWPLGATEVDAEQRNEKPQSLLGIARAGGRLTRPPLRAKASEAEFTGHGPGGWAPHETTSAFGKSRMYWA